MQFYSALMLHLGALLCFAGCWQMAGVWAGSCREASLCCNGRDSSCVVQKAPINAIIEDLTDKPCYCDHACLKLGDCCTDFKEHCGVLDCQVSDWGAWGECDATCGTGTMSRNRTITQMPHNGGKHCPSLSQRRGCQGYKCHHHRDRKILREMALLLPVSFSKSRRENDTIDIRRNLRLRYKDAFKHNRANEYCVEYEVVKASKPCHRMPPYDKLATGDRVTVRCDLEAFQKDVERDEVSNNSVLDSEDDEAQPPKPAYRCRGEGMPGRNTRFGAFATPSCHGKWIRLSLDRPKKCSGAQFIFV